MNKRYGPLLLFLLLTLTLGFLLFKPPASPVQRESSAMPPLSLRALDGAPTPVAWQAAPGQPTLLNFFASWCVPCLAEHAQIKAIAALEGVSVQGIVWNDGADNARAWLGEHGNPYDAVWLDPTGEAAMNLGLRGVPESFVIDGSGMVKLHIRGAITPASLPQLTALLTQLRDGAADAPGAR